MNDAELYRISNQHQTRDAVALLDEYSSKIKWKKDNLRVLDIGCGDGSVTTILSTYIPGSYKLLGCDISEAMVQHANREHRSERTSFTVFDVGGELPERLKGSFDHVFSFYALHWILDQERALTNIYELLSAGGDCFMIFLASASVFDVYRVLARSKKWTSWIQPLDPFISPYHDVKEPEKLVRKTLENIGFTEGNVECRDLEFTYESMDLARKAFKSICPSKIPSDLCNDFMDDYEEAAKEMGMSCKINGGDTDTLKIMYRLLVVHARK